VVPGLSSIDGDHSGCWTWMLLVDVWTGSGAFQQKGTANMNYVSESAALEDRETRETVFVLI
jgi:hypothetical protein